MKYILLYLLIINASTFTYTQKCIHLKDYDIIATIFEETYSPSFIIDSISGRFTPSEDQVKSAESLLQVFDLHRRSKIIKRRRQYLGYEENGIEYLLIHILYYKTKKQFEKDFPKWKSEFSYLFTDPEDIQKSFLYKYNVADHTIGFY